MCEATYIHLPIPFIIIIRNLLIHMYLELERAKKITYIEILIFWNKKIKYYEK